MSKIDINRKRKHSDDIFSGPQRKYHVNQQLQDLMDENKMKEIYEKTRNLLFKAANNKQDNNKIQIIDKYEKFKMILLYGNGIIAADGGKLPDWVPKLPDRSCKSCFKMAKIHVDCVNCNLELCEFCGHNCWYCREPICGSCISLFNCGTIDNPFCGRCNIYQ